MSTGRERAAEDAILDDIDNYKLTLSSMCALAYVLEKRYDAESQRGLRQIRYNFVRTHSTLGMTPAESAGVSFGHPDKWLTMISCAADHNNACKLGERPSITDDPRRAGFQVIPLFRY